MQSDCFGGSSMLVGEEKGVHDYSVTSILYKNNSFTTILLYFPFSNKSNPDRYKYSASVVAFTILLISSKQRSRFKNTFF